MSRSPLAYPMHRVDADAGSAADLQTDVMRFMAILALCLVAIFALVQSIPLAPVLPPETPVGVTATSVPVEPPTPAALPPRPVALQPVPLTRPATTPRQAPMPRPAPPVATTDATETSAAVDEPEGFSLRFESDLALTRLVAAGRVGLYAVSDGRARRMTVSESRLSFWDASMPASFHEMEPATVPDAVVDALARTGGADANVAWGVTLPVSTSRQLDALMREHRGGRLIIGANGDLRREAT